MTWAFYTVDTSSFCGSGFFYRSFGEFLAAEDFYRFVIEGLDEILTEEEWFELTDYFFSGHIPTNEVKRFCLRG